MSNTNQAFAPPEVLPSGSQGPPSWALNPNLVPSHTCTPSPDDTTGLTPTIRHTLSRRFAASDHGHVSAAAPRISRFHASHILVGGELDRGRAAAQLAGGAGVLSGHTVDLFAVLVEDFVGVAAVLAGDTKLAVTAAEEVL